jgi:hypothetical protein
MVVKTSYFPVFRKRFSRLFRGRLCGIKVKFGGVKPHICRFSEKFLSDRFAAAFADLKCDFTAFFPPPGSRFKQMKIRPLRG